MISFVILAAGKGTRNRSDIHKALLPLRGKAVLSHLFDLAPKDARLAVVVGHKAQQIKDYCRLAHPDLYVEFIEVSDYDAPGSGPGESLLAAVPFVGRFAFSFTTCDTLWEKDESLWEAEGSWVGVAPIPEGTEPQRWCRILSDGTVVDKQVGEDGEVWTGLAHVASNDVQDFWQGIRGAGLVDEERQISGGLAAIKLDTHKINWTDVGDALAYEQAVGYDNSKPGEVTYVLPNRVVKAWTDPQIASERIQRSRLLYPAVPLVSDFTETMLVYEYQEGQMAYDAIDSFLAIADALKQWAETQLWLPPATMITPSFMEFSEACYEFYKTKTYIRIAKLKPELQKLIEPLLTYIPWDTVTMGGTVSGIHGDLNLSNVIVKDDGSFVGIDWRQNFGGQVRWGDQRYDKAKLLASTKVHWGRARNGDFSEWANGPTVAKYFQWSDSSIEVIGALSLINSAPLHKSPLDRILVERGVKWLEEIL